MSLLHIDGFDAYGIDLTDVSTVLGSSLYQTGVYCNTSAATRNNLGYSIKIAARTDSNSEFRKAFANSTGVVAGQALYWSPTTLFQLFSFMYDDLLGTVREQVRISVNSTGGISLINGNGELVAASNPNVVFPYVWHYIECKYQPGVGTIVKVDGATVINSVAITNKHPAAPNTVNLYRCGFDAFYDYNHNLGGGAYKLVDDLYVLDLNGSAPFNDFMNDVTVYSVLPVSDATPNAASKFGGSLGHFTAVNQIPSDEDTSYLYTNSTSIEELFNVATLPANIIDVMAVSVHVRAKKDAAGLANYKVEAKLGASLVQSPIQPITTAYVTREMIMETKPGGGAWTKTDAQNTLIGFQTVT